MNKPSPQRLLVRSARSHKFLKATGRWTKSAEQACNFPNLLNAIHTCMAKGMKDVELVFRGDGVTEQCFPLSGW
jgi:hypothetical protein